ncbi:MAG: 16S rRNA (guanine(966)-N(2))-methyltransferase RsmD [Clostridia bacterium]|nr:16S rRNA (guanine(966)-N(2))-methyltransferase RsmD [Clostridia bacterium]
MRIIGGQFRSRVLATFEGENIRPTSDRAKEALFNILFNRIYGARVLDLFSGSGALGLESLSRGASQAVFNDFSKASIAVLQKNIKALNVQEKATVYNYDYLRCLNVLKGKFDIIFLDPPYRMDYGVTAINTVMERGLLAQNGVIVYERDRPFENQASLPPFLKQTDERKYGKTYFTFFMQNLEREEQSV